MHFTYNDECAAVSHFPYPVVAGPRPFPVGSCDLEPGCFELKHLGFTDEDGATLAGKEPAAVDKTGTAQTLTFTDTVLNRAVVRAYRACMAEMERCMQQSVAKYKYEFKTLHDSIQLWNKTWLKLVDQLDMAY